MNNNADIREKKITRTSIIGVLTNIALAGFKAFTGLVSGSVSIVLDALNNLTDVLSSVITIIGIKLAKRPPDKKHPFGHGRIEYFSAIIISVIIVGAGTLSLVESVKKIIAPETPDYSVATIIIVVTAIAVKLVLGRYVKSVGVKYNSDALTASGADATYDAFLTLSTLIGVIVTLIWGISVDGIIGALISLYIIKAGVEMLMKPVNHVVGTREDSETTKGIKRLIRTIDGVQGVYDLIIHNYGPNYAIGSVHIEVPDTFTAKQIHEITNSIQRAVFAEYSVFLTVGIYAIDTQDAQLAEMRNVIRECTESRPGALNAHGIFIKEAEKTINFDIVVDFKVQDKQALIQEITDSIKAVYPEYTVCVNVDTDFSD